VLCLTQAGLQLKAPLILESVVEEEAGGGGTLAAVLRGYRADAAIVAEPTGSDNLCIGTCGSRFFRIRVAGQAGMPQLAREHISAIEPAWKIHQHLARFNEQRAARLRGRHPLFETELPCPMSGAGQVASLNVGVLRAGDWPATVPGWAELEGRIGFPPSEQGDDVMTDLEHAVETCAREDAWLTEHSPAVTWWGARREGFELPLAEPVVQTMRRSVKRILGQGSTVFGSPAATDAAYFTPRLNGHGGCPAVIYGPGGAYAHGPDEYVEIGDMIRVTKVLVAAILDWCEFDPPD
jgi:acetylornithine deacetylase